VAVTLATLDLDRLRKGTERFDAWVETPTFDPDGNAITYRDGERSLSDPSSYGAAFGGPAIGRITGFSRYDVYLSDRTGVLSGTTLSYTEADTDRRIRDSVTNQFQNAFLGAQQTIRAIFESDRIATKTPLVVFRGVAKAPAGQAPYTAARTSVDWLSARLAIAVAIPTIQQLFPGASANVLARLLPIWLGLLTDAASDAVTGAPVLTAESASGADVAGSAATNYGPLPAGTALAGFGSLAGVLPAPATFTPVEAPQGSGSPGNAYGPALNSEAAFHFQRWAYDAGGNEGDPIPFLPFDAAGKVVFVSDPSEADFTAAAVPGATGYRTASGQLYDTTPKTYKWQQTLDSGGATSAVMNQTPHDNVDLGSVDPLTLAAGATVAAGPARKLYCLTAVTASGETAPSGFWVARPSPYRRPNRGTVSSVAGATSYNLYAADLTSDGSVPTFTQVKSIPTTNVNGGGDIFWEDDLLGTGFGATSGVGGVAGGGVTKGRIPGIYVGGNYVDTTSTAWSAVAFACHPMANWDAVFTRDSQGNSVDLTPLIDSQISYPGATGFVGRWGANPFLVVGSFNVAVAYVKGQLATDLASGAKTIFMNGGGVEDVGDGSGTRLDSVYQQKQWFARNFAMANAQWGGGLWATIDPAWPDGASRLDTASFAAISLSAAPVLDDETIAFGITSSVRISDVCQIFAVAGDHRFTPGLKGAFRVVLQPPIQIPVLPTHNLTENGEYLKNAFTFTVRDDPTFWFTRSTFSADPVWDASGNVSYMTTGTVTDPTGVSKYGFLDNQSTITIPVAMSTTRRGQLLARIMRRAGTPSSIGIGTTHVNGLAIEVGDYGTSQHREAPWAPLTPRLVQVEVLSPALSGQQVTLQVEDIDKYNDVEFATMLASEVRVFGGSEDDQIANAAYESGAGSDTAHPNTSEWLEDSNSLPGTYVLEVGYGLVDDPAHTLIVGIFNLSDGSPDTPIETVTITSASRTRDESTAFAFTAAGGTRKRYVVKSQVSGGWAKAWGIRVRRVS
jgi:hypothetical protein